MEETSVWNSKKRTNKQEENETEKKEKTNVGVCAGAYWARRRKQNKLMAFASKKKNIWRNKPTQLDQRSAMNAWQIYPSMSIICPFDILINNLSIGDAKEILLYARDWLSCLFNRNIEKFLFRFDCIWSLDNRRDFLFQKARKYINMSCQCIDDRWSIPKSK